MSYQFLCGMGAGFSVGWAAALCMVFAVQCYNRRHGYDR